MSETSATIRGHVPALFAVIVAVTAAVGAQTGGPQNPSSPPARDTPGQVAQTDQLATARISGRVVAADTGRPVRRARVSLGASDARVGRSALSDDDGSFDFTDLPEGRYSVSATRTGFIAFSYGQRRPRQAGTPLQLRAGQHVKDVEVRLPRAAAIAGRIEDEAGEPMPGTTVRVMKYQFSQGSRQLVPAGNAQTDDRGHYRVWGLEPGEYFVSAVPRNFDITARERALAGGRGVPPFGGRGGRPASTGLLDRPVAPPPDRDDPAQVGYAPTFFPGVSSVHEAHPVTVGLGGEALDVDFRVVLVKTARISGRVTGPDGSAAWAGGVMLVPESATAAGRPAGTVYNGRIEWDGAFTIFSVPPARYTLRVTGEASEHPQFASLPLTVDGADLSDLLIILSPGASVAGAVRFQGTGGRPQPNPADVRVQIVPVEPQGGRGAVSSRVTKEGTFQVEHIPAGTHHLRVQAPRDWMLESIFDDGRDLADAALDLRPAQGLSGLELVFTDRVCELAGTLTTASGQPLTEYTVLVFSTDASLWRPQSRHISTARPDQNGRYQLRGLPPGDYFVAPIDPEEPGAWFEPSFLEGHRPNAARVALAYGRTATQNFTVAAR